MKEFKCTRFTEGLSPSSRLINRVSNKLHQVCKLYPHFDYYPRKSTVSIDEDDLFEQNVPFLQPHRIYVGR